MKKYVPFISNLLKEEKTRMFSNMELAIKYVGIAALSETQSRLDREQSSGFFPSSLARRRKGKIMQILKWQKRKRDWGGRGKRTTAEVLQYFELPFQGNGIPIGRLLVNLSTTKTAKSQRSAVFTAAFCSTWRTDKVRELHSSFQMVFKEANCFCGTLTIFSVKICPLLAPQFFQYVRG